MFLQGAFIGNTATDLTGKEANPRSHGCERCGQTSRQRRSKCRGENARLRPAECELNLNHPHACEDSIHLRALGEAENSGQTNPPQRRSVPAVINGTAVGPGCRYMYCPV